MKIRKVASGYKLILGYLGVFLIVIGLICLLPLFTLIAFPEESKFATNFIVPGLASIAVGILLACFIIKHDKAQLGKHQDSVLLVLVWLFAILICAVPFAMSKIQLGNDGMTFSESVFESASGYCTVGLTRFKMYDLHIYVIFRSCLLLFGGVGLVLIITSAISDRYGLKLYVAEGHNDQLMPNLAKSARLILGIYIGYIFLGTIAYTLAGMPLFDSINHSISAVATGGFSSRVGGLSEITASLESGNAAAIEIISCILMLLGGTNFLIHLFLLTGRFKKAWRDVEIRFFIILSLVMIPLFVASVALSGLNYSFGESLRYGTFTFISAITTTGFTNTANVVWLGEGVLFLIVLANIIGGGSGSTAGGAKQYRFAVAFKSIYWTIRYKLSPKKYVYPYYVWNKGEQKYIEATECLDCYVYIIVYTACMFIGSFIVLLFSIGGGIDISYGDALFEFSNAISSSGFSNGVTALSNSGMLWTMSIGMLAGRLEIFAIYFAFYRGFRDLVRKETV